MTGELWDFENSCGVPTDPSYNWDNLWQMAKLRTMRSQIISPTCSIPNRKICDSEYISAEERRPSMWNLVSIAGSFVITSSSATKLPPIHHFLFIMSAFRLISNTKLLFRLKAWVCEIVFYEPEKVLKYTFLTSAVFIHCCSSFKENIINVVSIFSQNIERVLTKHLMLFSSECNKLTVDFKLPFYPFIQMTQQILFNRILVLCEFEKRFDRKCCLVTVWH